jgi:predicted HD phosphohydrolase
MYDRQESEYYQAKLKAARRICKGWVKPKDLPSNAEIRDEIQNLSRIHEGDARTGRLLEMRLEALRMMRLLERFRPRLIGSVLTGHIRHGSDIDLHLFSDNVHAVTGELDFHNIGYETERKQVVKNGQPQVYRHVHVRDRFDVELTIYPEDKLGYSFKSSITGKAIEKASIAQLEQLLQREYPELDLARALAEVEDKVDRFALFYSLLLPLENVKQAPKYHPEGDALYHSLQVFDLACDKLPYDEEFLLAALLHDVGKGIDRLNHVSAGLEAVRDHVTPRTAWLIEHHMSAHQILDRSIGSRAHRRLRENENYEELILLGECDRDGRQTGVPTTELEAALEYIRELGSMFG